MRRVLFLCYANRCRSQMAEGFARGIAPADVEIYSAGIEAGADIHPNTVRVMSEAGVDISGQSPKSLDSLGVSFFDLTVTLCEEAHDVCPVLPGTPGVVGWNLPNPERAEGTDAEILDAFRATRDRIRQLTADLFERGYFDTLSALRANFNDVLNNLSDGILVHDLSRRILHFNTAAERITGYKAAEVIGLDCHDLFPDGFCGGKCGFRGEPCTHDFERKQYPLNIATRDGETRHVEMSVIPMCDAAGASVGVMASFRDITSELHLKERLREVEQFAGIIGRDHSMQHIYKTIRDTAGSDAPVMLLGETGTGKELVAAALHNESRRAGALFVPVNCGALPEGIIESELFGHVRGAFTGAVRDKKGRFEMAHGGTIFLDEIGDLPQPLQVKLLRVLQEGTFERVGGEQTMRVDVRVISATNQDLKKLMAEGRFREDLYYRLCVVPIHIPPMRERRADIPMLAQHFLKIHAAQQGRGDMSLSRAAVDAMLDFQWPGNVRQLQNAIQFALMKCKDNTIEPYHLPPEIYAPPEIKHRGRPGRKPKLNDDTVSDALTRAGGNKAKAARFLGVGRATLYRYLLYSPVAAEFESE